MKSRKDNFLKEMELGLETTETKSARRNSANVENGKIYIKIHKIKTNQIQVKYKNIKLS